MPATAQHALNLDLHADPAIKEAAANLALEGFSGTGRAAEATVPEFDGLRALGTEIWLDTGDQKAIAPIWCRETTGLTTNNTLVNQVVQSGALDAVIPKATERLKTAGALPREDLAFELGFVANARIALGLVERFGAQVSVELHPSMSTDIDASLLFARRYYSLCPERFIIKIPLQPAGFLIVRRLTDEGIPVNYTLGFSARQNYLAALFSRPRYVNVFLGRLNAVVQDNGLGDPKNIGEKATRASQEAVRELRRSDGSLPTLQIAASIRNGRQVADLAGIDVQTIPPKAAEEFRGLRLGPSQLHESRAADLEVEIGPTPHRAQIENLWTVDDRFKAYAGAVAGMNTRGWSGEEFARAARDHGIELFHDWTDQEVETVRSDGKIPKVAKWDGVPLDDLMTQSALQSFASDQQALDSHLLGLAE